MARDFDGADDIITATMVPELTTAEFTIGAWINADGPGEASQGRFISLAGGSGLIVGRVGVGPVLTFTTNYSTTTAVATSSTTISTGTWYLVVMTLATDNVPRIYYGPSGAALSEVAYTTQTTGVGTRTVLGASSTANVGSNTATTVTFDGRIAHAFHVPWRIRGDEMEALRLGLNGVLFRGGQPSFYLPLDSPTATQADDRSGRATAWSVNGGAALAEGPPVRRCLAG